MGKIYTTEITSTEITSDNPIHQRLFKAYVLAESYIKGDVLEVGCGQGRGLELLIPKAKSYTAIDKIEGAVQVKCIFPQKASYLNTPVVVTGIGKAIGSLIKAI